MSLLSLKGSNVRNLHPFDLKFSPRLNLITGANASGKTSLLESIYYLSTSRSFRTNNSKNIINHSANDFILFGKFSNSSSTTPIPVGIQKKHDSIKIKVDGESITQSSALIKRFPTTVINPDNQTLITSGPSLRRKLLDWGLFHVEHRYLELHKRFQKIIKHRNALLRNKSKEKDIAVWSKQLINVAQSINSVRESYVESVINELNIILPSISNIPEIGLIYYPGWNNKKGSYDVILNNSFEQDIRIGHTKYGPHRADIIISIDGVPAAEVLSRGQLKLLSTAFIIAQIHLVNLVSKVPCMILIDDLPSELDIQSRQMVLELLSRTNSQLFVTSTDASLLDISMFKDKSMFHVEHGILKEVV